MYDEGKSTHDLGLESYCVLSRNDEDILCPIKTGTESTSCINVMDIKACIVILGKVEIIIKWDPCLNGVLEGTVKKCYLEVPSESPACPGLSCLRFVSSLTHNFTWSYIRHHILTI